jgi:hypothetical protein
VLTVAETAMTAKGPIVSAAISALARLIIHSRRSDVEEQVQVVEVR